MVINYFVTRTTLSKAGIESGGLWTISRGLARNVQTYREMLARADYPRQEGPDGRGNQSNRELAGFCTFFLSKALDQVEFMASLLELDAMQDRIMRYASHMRTMEDALSV